MQKLNLWLLQFLMQKLNLWLLQFLMQKLQALQTLLIQVDRTKPHLWQLNRTLDLNPSFNLNEPLYLGRFIHLNQNPSSFSEIVPHFNPTAQSTQAPTAYLFKTIVILSGMCTHSQPRTTTAKLNK